MTPEQLIANATALAQSLMPGGGTLVRTVQRLLNRKKQPSSRNRKEAGEQMLEWLASHGRFILTPLGARYYLYRAPASDAPGGPGGAAGSGGTGDRDRTGGRETDREREGTGRITSGTRRAGERHRLFRLGTDAWRAWLYRLTGANPAGADFRYLDADCAAAAEDGERLDVVRVSHWDDASQTLRISRFDGSVYRLDGATIVLEANGDGPALFDDAPHYLPYTPEFSDGTDSLRGTDDPGARGGPGGPGYPVDAEPPGHADRPGGPGGPGGPGDPPAGAMLRWSTDDVPNWAGDREESELLYRAWWLATFFTELCPTRIILVVRGEKGSSKTTSIRVLLRLLFGPFADVCGVPEKPDAFVALTSNAHVVVLDNLDDFAPALRDKLAALATGKQDQVRELYTTNEVLTIQYRCWLAVTSRTPDTLQSDDIADRVLVLPVERMAEGERRRESLLLNEVIDRLNRWWGDTLTALNAVVASLRHTGLPERGGLRMEDWAALGAVVARAGGQEAIWERGLERVRAAQGALLLEDDVITSAVETWLASPRYTDRPVLTRDLYQHAQHALFGPDRPDASWPRSVKGFGRRLAGVRRELQDRLARDGVYMSWNDSHARQTTYTFVK